MSSSRGKLRAPRRFSRFSCLSSLSEGRCPARLFPALDLDVENAPLPLFDGEDLRAVKEKLYFHLISLDVVLLIIWTWQTYSYSSWTRWSCRICRTSQRRTQACEPTRCPTKNRGCSHGTGWVQINSLIYCNCHINIWADVIDWGLFLEWLVSSCVRSTHPIMDERLPGVLQFLNQSVRQDLIKSLISLKNSLRLLGNCGRNQRRRSHWESWDLY